MNSIYERGGGEGNVYVIDGEMCEFIPFITRFKKHVSLYAQAPGSRLEQVWHIFEYDLTKLKCQERKEKNNILKRERRKHKQFVKAILNQKLCADIVYDIISFL